MGQVQAVAIESQVGTGAWSQTTAVLARQGQRVALRVAPIPKGSIRWYRIRPRLDVRYNNAVWPWLPGAYRWKGYDTIHYQREPLPQYNGQWTIEPWRSKPVEAAPSGVWARLWAWVRQWGGSDPPASFERSDLGSFWFQAEVRAGETLWRSPGLEARTAKGLSPEVLRVSIRQSDDLLGHLTAYFNVPGIFGSTPYQVRHHIGVDCADVLMAAHANWQGTTLTRDYNVAMLTEQFPVLLQTKVTAGEPAADIRWGRTVRAGDWLAVKYPGGTQYQHIGALYKDANGNGRLDAADWVLHAGPDPLQISALAAGGFDGTVLVLRPR